MVNVLVAQWTERWFAEPKAGGSTPPEDAAINWKSIMGSENSQSPAQRRALLVCMAYIINVEGKSL